MRKLKFYICKILTTYFWSKKRKMRELKQHLERFIENIETYTKNEGVNEYFKIKNRNDNSLDFQYGFSNLYLVGRLSLKTGQEIILIKVYHTLNDLKETHLENLDTMILPSGRIYFLNRTDVTIDVNDYMNKLILTIRTNINLS